MTDQPPYRDPALGVDERVADLMARMTRDEKVAQLCGVWLTLDPDGGEVAPYQGMFSQGGLDVAEKLRHGIGQITRPLGSAPVDPVVVASTFGSGHTTMVSVSSFSS